VPALINGGMSDDGFTDFRYWLISRGRDVYERALADPDSLTCPRLIARHDPASWFA
jgi:hypothetical protein